MSQLSALLLSRLTLKYFPLIVKSPVHRLNKMFSKLLGNSVTRLGDFYKFFVTDFCTKVAQILNAYFKLFEKYPF